MSHTLFCCNSSCSNTFQVRNSLRCDNCKTSWYCNKKCKTSDWKTHKNDCHSRYDVDAELYQIVASRLGYDTDHYTFAQFQEFMVFESHRYASRSIQEWMEDWLEGFYTEERERKETLRSLFQTNCLRWSNDAYTLYQSWSKDRQGNRYQKMTEFINVTEILF